MGVLPMKMASMMMAMIMIDVVVSLEEHKLAPVSMKLSSKFFPDNWVYVNFYGDTLQGFYQCLSGNTSSTCTGDLARDEKRPFAGSDRRFVGLIKPKITQPSNNNSNYFSCEYDFLNDELSCQRLDSVDKVCDAHMNVQHFRMQGNDSSILKCVGLIWHSPVESLNFDINIHGIKLCNDVCNATNALNISHQHDDQNNQNDHNDKPHWGNPRVPDDEFHDRKAHIVIIVVASIGLTTLLIIAAGIFRRKLLQMKSQPQAPTRVESGDNKQQLNRKISSSSRNFSIYIPEKTNPVVLSPSKLYSEI